MTDSSATETASAGEDSGNGGSSSLMRSSAVMAIGTTVSRITGFGRTVVLAAALGTQLLGDAYNTANTIPFTINDLFLGGLMVSVIVPFLVKRRKRDADGGEATEQRVFTSTVVLLFVVTVTAILAAETLVRLYAGDFTGRQFEVSVTLARFLLAQIFFVGLSGLISAMLNTRNRFGAPVWAPVLNNLVIIGVGVMFLVVAGPGTTPETITSGQITLLGAGTASGMALQGLTLMWALYATGFRWRPRFDLRDSGLGEALRAAGWMFGYICTTQAGLLVTANLVNRAGVAAAQGESSVGAGLTTYNYAYQLFQLPYAIIAVSVITVLLPHMSDHAADHRWREVREDFSRALRMSAVILVPIALLMAVFAVHVCLLVFQRGSTSFEDAQNIGYTLTAFSLGLIPFATFQLMLRVFYAMGDTRTPAFLGLANLTMHTALGVTAFLVLPPRYVVIGVAAGFMLSFVSGSLLAGTVISRRLGGLDGRRILSTLTRLYLATLPSVAVALGIAWFFESRFGSGTLTIIGAPIVGCLIGGPLFLGVARLIRVRETRVMLDLVRTRLLKRG